MASRGTFGQSAEAPEHAASRPKHEAASRAPIAGPKPDENATTNAERTPRGRMPRRARTRAEAEPNANQNQSKPESKRSFASQANGEQNADLLSRGEDEVEDEQEHPPRFPFDLLCSDGRGRARTACDGTL